MKVAHSFGKFGRHKPLLTSTPTKIMGPRTRSHTTIWNLPEELILHIVRRLPVKDVLNMMSVHTYFHDFIKDNPTVWSTVSFRETWPSVGNAHHFKRSAELGNFEAAIKLAIAYLYHEGLPWNEHGTDSANGDNASQMFCLAESLNKSSSPFTWLFIRPPWSQCGSCCKQCVFTKMTKYVSEDPSTQGRIHICLAKIFQLLDIEEKTTYETAHLMAASQCGSTLGAYMLWQQKYSHTITDRGEELASIRELRDIAAHGQFEERLHLCRYYVNGKYGGISKTHAAAFVRNTMQSSKVSASQNVFSTSQALTPSMRYILIDWLVEVVGMKDFSSQVLHVAINVIDRYLLVNDTPRSKLQLLGVAALVLCSRYLGRDIITIREAAWLTDNTYKYEDVVRMMGEITATLDGKLRVPTIIDYNELISSLVGLGSVPNSLSRYICELTLLQAKMGQYTHSEIAACSVILAKVLLHSENCWTSEMELFTGFSLASLAPCLMHMYQRCYLEGSVISHRDVTLQAVKDRYSTDKHHNVGKTHMMELSEVCSVLGLTEESPLHLYAKHSLYGHRQIIKSPARCAQNNTLSIYEEHVYDERTKSSTPCIDHNLNESVMSGYEGDMEDEPDCDLPMEYSDNQVIPPSFTHDDDTFFATLSNLPASTFSHLNLSQQLAESCQKSTENSIDNESQGMENSIDSPNRPSSSGVSSLSASAHVLDSSSDTDSESRSIPSERRSKQFLRSRSKFWTSLKRKRSSQSGSASKTFVFS